jgi:hypothetical protein
MKGSHQAMRNNPHLGQQYRFNGLRKIQTINLGGEIVVHSGGAESLRLTDMTISLDNLNRNTTNGGYLSHRAVSKRNTELKITDFSVKNSPRNNNIPWGRLSDKRKMTSKMFATTLNLD